MFDVLFGLIAAFVTTYVSMPVIIRIAEHKKLFDVPNERKVHKAPIASLGGIGIFAGFILSALLFVNFFKGQEFAALIAAAFVLFLLGMKDDIVVISPLKKFLGQTLAALILVFKGHVVISSLHGFAGIEQIPSFVGIGISFLAIILIINAFNLIDGLDGLAGSLGMLSASLFGFFFLNNLFYSYAVIAFALSGSLLAFLWYNFQPARIFMGDTGSLLVGLVNAVLVIRFVEMAPHATYFHSSVSLAMGCSILVVPIMDTLRVFAIRLIQKRSPFSADRNHIHHILLDKGFSHNNVTLILLGFSAAMIFMTYLTSLLGTTTLIVLIILSYFTGIILLKKLPIKLRAITLSPSAAHVLLTGSRLTMPSELSLMNESAEV